jgi:hypothetical protein
MLTWLLRLWNRFGAWMMHRSAGSAHPSPMSQPYHPSNLHGRHR